MKPVRLSAAATLALPRWALFALGLMYILPGLIGRDPWKEDAGSFGIMWTMANGGLSDWLAPNIAGLAVADAGGPLAFWVGALCIKLFGWALGDVMAARVSTIAVFMLGTISVWYTAFHLGRRPDAQPLRLAFGGQPEPDDYGRTLADTAALIYLGCLGLLLFSHETLAVTLQGALVASFLYRAVRYVEAPSLRNAALVGLTLGGLLLSYHWLTPVTLVLALFLCTRFLSVPAALTLRDMAFAAAIALLIAAIWIVPALLLQPHNAAPVEGWLAWSTRQLGLPSVTSVKTFFRVGIWFFWPAWPFAAWAIYAWRRQDHLLHIVLPLSFVGALTLLIMCDPAPENGDLLKLLPGYKPEFYLLSFIVAAGATIGWIMLVHWRVSRRPAVLWRAVVLSSGGLILLWVLLLTLFLPDLNYSKSYAGVAREIAAKLPQGARCIDSNAGPAQRASFAYFGQLPFARSDSGKCDLLLVQDSIKVRDDKELKARNHSEWVLLWEGKRPSDKDERFRLYQRRPSP